MNKYRYQYLKWTDDAGHSASNKSVCPNCGKKTFVRVIDTETNELLPDYVGKCDRQNKCGYCYSYAQYFKDHSVTGIKRSFMRKQSKPECMKRKTIDIIKPEVMYPTLNKTCFLKKYLKKIFGDDLVENCFTRYFVGADKYQYTIFWQVDSERNIRTAKRMLYNENTGHRRKEDNTISFIHAALKRDGTLPVEWSATQVLFGSHLLKDHPNQPVCIVESEKTAIICSLLIPNVVWLATGGKQNMKQLMFEPLRGRNVVFYPDLGAYNEWEDKAKLLALRCGFKHTLSQILEKEATVEERAEGLDIADYLLKNYKDIHNQ